MKKFIVSKCMDYIKKNSNYNSVKLKEIEYGIVSIYLTLTKIIIIIAFAIFLGILNEVIIFLVLFNILRSTAFGLHATKSWICLLSSILIFIGIPLISKHINVTIYIKLFIGIICTIFMYKNAPADTKKRPIVNKRRRLTYKIISTIISIIFLITSIISKNNFISNCLMFSIILENIMISPLTYKLFKLPYNNYIAFLMEHPDFSN